MKKTTKYILWIIIISSITALIIWAKQIEIGTILAGLATFFAALKSKIFGPSRLDKLIEDIDREHEIKRSEWEATKRNYDAQVSALRARMEYHDYRSALITEKIGHLDQTEREALQKNQNLTDTEILQRLNNL